MQPVCGEGYECGEVVETIDPPTTHAEPATVAWIVLGISVAVIVAVAEAWLLAHHQRTMSQKAQTILTWAKVVVASAIGVIVWHILFGFPGR